MRTRRSARCTCVPFSTCAATAPRRCARSRKRRARWCASTRGRSPASTATASCAANGWAGSSVPRLDASVRGDQGPLRSRGSHESRARSCAGRRWTTRRCSAFLPAIAIQAVDDRARLVGVERAERPAHRRVDARRNRRRSRRRIRQSRRDVQQQRPLPQVRRGDDVPELSRDPRRGRISRAAARTRCGRRCRESSATEGLASDAVHEALDLCVSCKGCRRECPTGVDMAKMKIEALHRRQAVHGLPLRDRLVAHLPRWAPWAARMPWLANLRNERSGHGEAERGVARLLGAAIAARVARRHVPARARTRLPAMPGRTPTSCCSSTRSPTISSPRTRVRR